MSVKVFVIAVAAVAALAGAAFVMHHPGSASFLHSMMGTLHGAGR